jgi:hypothetical protein
MKRTKELVMCQNCSKELGVAGHTCPFIEEIYPGEGDDELCNCCTDCEYQCVMDV